MRVLVVGRGGDEPVADGRLDGATVSALADFDGSLARAGILLAGERLRPTAEGVRVRGSSRRVAVTDGPPVETAPITSVWLWQVRSLDEAVEWARRCPLTAAGGELELRPVAEAVPDPPIRAIPT